MNDKVEGFIHDAYETLKSGDENSALGFLKEALKVDFEHKEVLYALKCLNWWLEKLRRLDDFYGPFERGEYILSLWESYNAFLELIGNAFDSCQYALKRFVFTRALNYYLELLGDGTNQQDPALLLQAGRCCKGAGEWEEALRYIEQASRLRREDSAILSELADINALLGETRAAKVLFREAFYLDPLGIDLTGLESEMIRKLIDKIRDLGYSGNELAEWVPVWGCVWGIFSVKRELKPVELGRLKQSILSLENEYRNKNGKASADLSGDKSRVKPRLLNRYFWLIDYCEHNKDTTGLIDKGLIDETMLKIKLIDPLVHEHYKT
jgi:tetratricopeptide (TPR) repeat protein